MKRLFFAATMLSLAAGAGAEGAALPPDTIAKVGNEIITFSDLNTMLNVPACLKAAQGALEKKSR